MTDERKFCPTCPVSLICMSGRLKIKWRCDGCAKILVETRPEEVDEEDNCRFVTKHHGNQLVDCDVNIPVPVRESILPQLCSKCYLKDRAGLADNKEYWRDTPL